MKSTTLSSNDAAVRKKEAKVDMGRDYLKFSQKIINILLKQKNLEGRFIDKDIYSSIKSPLPERDKQYAVERALALVKRLRERKEEVQPIFHNALFKLEKIARKEIKHFCPKEERRTIDVHLYNGEEEDYEYEIYVKYFALSGIEKRNSFKIVVRRTNELYKGKRDEIYKKSKEYARSERGRKIHGRYVAKQRGFGFNPISKSIDVPYVWHHVNKQDVVAVSKEIHMLKPHTIGENSAFGIEPRWRRVEDYLGKIPAVMVEGVLG